MIFQIFASAFASADLLARIFASAFASADLHPLIFACASASADLHAQIFACASASADLEISTSDTSLIQSSTHRAVLAHAKALNKSGVLSGDSIPEPLDHLATALPMRPLRVRIMRPLKATQGPWVAYAATQSQNTLYKCTKYTLYLCTKYTLYALKITYKHIVSTTRTLDLTENYYKWLHYHADLN